MVHHQGVFAELASTAWVPSLETIEGIGMGAKIMDGAAVARSLFADTKRRAADT